MRIYLFYEKKLRPGFIVFCRIKTDGRIGILRDINHLGVTEGRKKEISKPPEAPERRDGHSCKRFLGV
jgi:hypothetical protein